MPEHTIELKDGRTLSYAELGSGEPVLVLDGPGSRGVARAAAREGYRLIAPDRPGWAKSTPKADVTYEGFAKDVIELMDKLGRHAPWLARILIRHAAKDPDKAAQRALKDLPEVDAEIMKDPAKQQINLQTTREIMTYPEGMVAEIQRMSRPWPIDFGAIRVPVSFWTGTRDITHPPQMARRLADRIVDATVHEVPGAFTFGLLPIYGDALAFCTAQPRSASTPSRRPSSRLKKSQSSTTLPSGSSA
jgi:pimeloyl-ACP methyl ester carboxylesterase